MRQCKRNLVSIKFSDNPHQIEVWLPLVMDGRDKNKPVAATRASNGFDIDFGKLTNKLINYLEERNVILNYDTEVIDLYKVDSKWYVIQKDLKTKHISKYETDFVFIGDEVYYKRVKRIPDSDGFRLTDYEWHYQTDNTYIRTTELIIEGVEYKQEEYRK